MWDVMPKGMLERIAEHHKQAGNMVDYEATIAMMKVEGERRKRKKKEGNRFARRVERRERMLRRATAL